MLVSRSTTKKENAEIYHRLMTEASMSLVQIVERNEDYGTVYVIYGYALVDELAKFACAECRIEQESGRLDA